VCIASVCLCIRPAVCIEFPYVCTRPAVCIASVFSVRGDMIEVFKILHKIYDVEITEGLLQLSNNTKTKDHSLKLSSQPSRIEIRRNSFSVKPWNSLPQEVVMSHKTYRCVILFLPNQTDIATVLKKLYKTFFLKSEIRIFFKKSAINVYFRFYGNEKRTRDGRFV